MAETKMDMIEALRPVRLLMISADVIEEVAKARKKHGPNSDLIDGTGRTESITYEANIKRLDENEAVADKLKKLNDGLCADGRKHTRLGILLEEAFEAAAESDPAALRAELVQVAAMSLDWISDIDDRGAPKR